MRTLTAAVLSVFFLGCGDSSGPQTMPAGLIGSWEARTSCIPECGITIFSVANPADSVDTTRLVATEVTIQAARFTLQSGGGATISGAARVEGTRIMVRGPSGAEEGIDYSLSPDGRLLTLFFDGVFDFNSDGSTEPARARGIFRRR
jgi:hypothetical protein